MDNRYLPTKHKHRQRGFTLIELIVSLALLALVMGAIGAGFHTISNGWTRAADRATQQDQIMRGLDILRRDLEAVERIWIEESDPPQVWFKGRENGLEFLVIEPPYPTKSGPYAIRYSVSMRDGKPVFVRGRKPYSTQNRKRREDASSNRVVLFGSDYRVRISYRDNSADRGSWKPVWKSVDGLPTLVRFELLDAQGETRITAPYIVALRHDIEMSCLERRPKHCTVKDVKLPGRNSNRGADRPGGRS